MTRAANDVMQSIIFSAVLDSLAALKRASGGLPNQLLRDVQAIHPNVTFADLPKELQDQIAESIETHMELSKQETFKRVVELLDLVGIPSPEKRAFDYPHQMSGGMRQRVMIAMALSCHPELLIADEPTTALDVTIQAQILELIYSLREKLNMAVLLITHDLGVVAEAADKVLVMYCGKIVEEADVKTLFNTPKHPYTVGLMESIPKLEEERDRLNAIRGMVPNPLRLPIGCAFSDRCDKCMDICKKQMPALVRKDGTAVRCFLYHNETEAGSK
jgi:peptide/nickel transport system ATP-binding protein